MERTCMTRSRYCIHIASCIHTYKRVLRRVGVVVMHNGPDPRRSALGVVTVLILCESLWNTQTDHHSTWPSWIAGLDGKNWFSRGIIQSSRVIGACILLDVDKCKCDSTHNLGVSTCYQTALATFRPQPPLSAHHQV